MSEKENEYLLNHLRQCGMYTCLECIYNHREKTHLGYLNGCVHEGTLFKGATREDWDLLRGSACTWFEPRCDASEKVALRNAEKDGITRELFAYANKITVHTDNHDSLNEKTLISIINRFSDLGFFV